MEPDADAAAGIRVDRDVVLGAHTSNSTTVATDHPVRYIEIEVPPHVRTGKGGPDSDGRLRLVTNLMDVPAELIAEAYRLRWLIELFFRMIKQLLGCRHLLSTKPGGVEIQMYLAIIACLLILIYTGRQPTKRTYEVPDWVYANAKKNATNAKLVERVVQLARILGREVATPDEARQMLHLPVRHD